MRKVLIYHFYKSVFETIWAICIVRRFAFWWIFCNFQPVQQFLKFEFCNGKNPLQTEPSNACRCNEKHVFYHTGVHFCKNRCHPATKTVGNNCDVLQVLLLYKMPQIRGVVANRPPFHRWARGIAKPCKIHQVASATNLLCHGQKHASITPPSVQKQHGIATAQRLKIHHFPPLVDSL